MHLPASLHFLQAALVFAIVLGVLVLVHEFGHFIVAKLCGVRVETFAIGFGSRLVGIIHNGTDYCIRALPLGGYVKFAGEYGGDSSTGAPDEFTSKTRFQRILIALAGPAANFVLSFVLLVLAAHFHHQVDQYLNGPAVVDYVPLDSAAARIGLAAGDTIVSFDGKPGPTWQSVLEESALHLNRPLPITFLHNGTPVSNTITITVPDGSEPGPDILAQSGLIAREQTGPVGVAAVEPGTPAARAGLRPGDKVVRIDNLEIHSVVTLLAYLKDHNGAPATLLVLRNGQPLTMAATPTQLPSPGAPTQYRLGFQPTQTPVDVVKLPWAAAVRESIQQNRSASTLILRTVQGLFTHQVSVKQMSGPVGIFQQIDLSAQYGFWPLITMMCLISINLAIFNLLPVPPLDGGMIFFLIVESILRRDVDQRIKERIYTVAFACIIFLAIFITFNDITRLHLGGKP